MKNKKKNVFLAGLMVLMMIVSLLSGMNLSVAKAAEPGMLEFTLIKKWATIPADGTEATFELTATPEKGEAQTQKIILSDTQRARDFYGFKVSEDKKTWTAKILATRYFQRSPITYTIKEEPLNNYIVSPNEPQAVTDSAIITFVNTNAKNLTIKKIWKDGDEKTGTKLTLTANGLPAGEVLLYFDNGWKKQISLPVYDLDGNPIEYVATETKINDETIKVTKKAKLVDDQDKPADKELIFDDSSVNKGNVQVTKTWTGTVGQASFGLFKKDSTDRLNYTVKVENAGTPDKSTVKVENLPLTDELGNAVQYEIKELDANNKIVASGDAVTINNRNYRVSYDENGNITNTEITSVSPVIPVTPTVPETTPLVPVTTPTTTVTVPETTPTVTVPDDSTPQGEANTSNESKKTTPSDTNTDDNDGVVAVDEDKVPEGTAKDKKDTSKEAPVNVDEDSTPKGTANLPKTGGTVGGLLSILGMGLLALGLAIRKRK